MKKEDIILGQNANRFADAGDGAYTAVYNQIKELFFDQYRQKLEDADYRLLSSCRFDGNTPEHANLFAAYESDTETVHLGYHEAESRLYVTYTPKEGFVRPAPKTAYTAIGDAYPTILTQPGMERFHPSAMATCYILRAADGSFVIIDSDFADGAAELIYDILKKQAPDPNHIVIASWMFTHPHTDHVGGFIDFAEKYAQGHGIVLRQAVCNFLNPERLSEHEANLQVQTYEGIKRFGDDVTVIKVHAGETLYYADLTFRVLYTQEEYLGVANEYGDGNCGSVVMQMETDSGVKVLFGADHAVFGSWYGMPFCDGALYRWYGSFIESDVVTAFHHGLGGGADTRIYPVIKPKIVLWPASWNRIYNDERGVAYGRSLVDAPCNQYFTDPEQAKANGVLGYYVSGDGIQILDLSDTALRMSVYESDKAYLES